MGGVAHTGYAATPIHHGVTYTAPVHHAAAYAAPVHHTVGIHGVAPAAIPAVHVPMQVLEDMLPTLLELFMLPNVKQRLILMLTTMHMDLGAMVLDTDSILMDMAIILDTLPLAMVVVLDMDMVMD